MGTESFRMMKIEADRNTKQARITVKIASMSCFMPKSCQLFFICFISSPRSSRFNAFVIPLDVTRCICRGSFQLFSRWSLAVVWTIVTTRCIPDVAQVATSLVFFSNESTSSTDACDPTDFLRKTVNSCVAISSELMFSRLRLSRSNLDDESITFDSSIDPNTFQPKIGFKTRYGMVSNPFVTTNGAYNGTPDGETLTANANMYYRRVQVTNLMWSRSQICMSGGPNRDLFFYTYVCMIDANHAERCCE